MPARAPAVGVRRADDQPQVRGLRRDRRHQQRRRENQRIDRSETGFGRPAAARETGGGSTVGRRRRSRRSTRTARLTPVARTTRTAADRPAALWRRRHRRRRRGTAHCDVPRPTVPRQATWCALRWRRRR